MEFPLGTIIGLLLGAFIAPWISLWTRYVTGPKLLITCCKNDRGVIVTTQQNETYVRLRVQNHGRSVAKETRIMAYDLLVPHPSGPIELDGEVLDLLWSRQDGETQMPIPAEAFRYADVAVLDLNKSYLSLCGANSPYASASLREGITELTVLATADGALSCKVRLKIEWDGKSDVKIISCRRIHFH
jgi:hypothetical protein